MIRKAAILFCLLVSIAGTAGAQNEQKKFFPIFGSSKLLRMEDDRYPLFRRGGTRVEFFVDGNQLRSILSSNLSTACALGRFNQKKNKRYYIWVTLPGGERKKFGYANWRGFNLRDPDHRVGRDQVYLFDMDRTSECRVYAVVTRR
ncbi:hypothetical protein [Aestuariispira ectoiniformans]|uniref:hypothetical protein n=1 Tax=Aestuariispira ectoiniformans TaxID=2775080 RepID=UPI00223BEDF6|nr:hypothetical protein [Aestuariispira ectoiniformans]